MSKLATEKQIKYLKKYKHNFRYISRNYDLLNNIRNQKFNTWSLQNASLIISELEEIRSAQYCKIHFNDYDDLLGDEF